MAIKVPNFSKICERKQ